MNGNHKSNFGKKSFFIILALLMLVQAPLGGLAAGLENPREIYSEIDDDWFDEDFDFEGDDWSDEDFDFEDDDWSDEDFDFEDDGWFDEDFDFEDDDLEFEIDESVGISASSAHQVSAMVQSGVTRRNTAFRRGPGADYRLIRTVNGSTNVRITGRSGVWYRVNVGGTVGFIRRSAVARTRQNAVVATNNAHVRSGRGTNHRSLTRVPRGQRVRVMRRAANWSRITVNGHTGWIRNRDLHVENAMRPGRTTVNNVTVHTRPRAAANVRHRLPRGTRLMIVQRTTNGWSQVRIRHANGTLHGWVRTRQIENRVHSRRLVRNGALRSGPGTSYNNLRTVARNTSVTVRSRVGNWYHVHFTANGRRQYGWLHQNNLPRLTIGPNVGSRALRPTWGVTYGSTRLRSGPGTSHAAIRTIADRTLIGTIHRRSGSWLEVTYRQLDNRGIVIRTHRGWIHHDSIRVGTTGATANNHNGRLNAATDLRRGAGTSYRVIRSLNNNASVTILRQSGAWLQVRAGSDVGWVQEHFVNSTTPGTTNITASLRSGPGNRYNQMTTIPSGVNLTILRHQGQWVNVRVEGRTGWMRALYVNIRTMSSNVPGVTNRVGSATTTTYVSGDPDLRVVVPTRRTIGVGRGFDILDGIRVERVAANGTVTRITPTWHASTSTWRFTHNDRTFIIEFDGMMDNLTSGTYERAVTIRRGNTVRARADQTIVVR